MLFAIFLAVIVPATLFRIAEKRMAADQKAEPGPSAGTEATQQEEQNNRIWVITDSGQVLMDLEAYITGVVLAEMPASFETEALKAQAVVARTYALKRVISGAKHENGAVCTDYGCCQAYTDPAAYKNQNGEEMAEKVRQAVLSTEGQVLTYKGSLIEATYFSCSGGRTEDAQAVWGQEIPYLMSVASPGEEGAAHYVDTVQFTLAEFCALLGVEVPPAHANWIGAFTYTAGGGVAAAELFGEEFSGTQLRKLLGLRSTAFTVTAVGSTVTVTTRGFGHRVGMSQYGADAMAISGSSYDQILSHYYPGTTLESWNE